MTVDSGQIFLVPAKGIPLQVRERSAMLGLRLKWPHGCENRPKEPMS